MRALVFGGAECVWDDVSAAKALSEFDVLIAVKRAGRDYPGKFDHWVSFHSEMFEDWIIARSRAGYPPCESLWTCTYRGCVSAPRNQSKLAVKRVSCEGGASGLIGVMVAKELNATKIVLAGIPMDPLQGRYDKVGKWREAIKHRVAWEAHLPLLKDSVRSMSGWTKELLGVPTKDWLLAD